MNLPSPHRPVIHLFWPVLGLVLLAGLGLRLAHFDSVWTYWTLDYLSYYGPLRDDLGAGLFPWTRLVGLHPPQHGLLASGMLANGASVAAVVWLSIAFSLTAVVLAALTLRELGLPGGGLIAAAALALSPYQVHYGVELNNYPMFLFGGSALAWAAVRTIRTSRCSRLDLVVLAGAALVTLHGHAAGLPLVGTLLLLFVAAWRPRPALALGIATLLFAPVGAAILAMTHGESTFHNAQLSVSSLLLELSRSWFGRFGPSWGITSASLLTLTGLGAAVLTRPEQDPLGPIQHRCAIGGGILLASSLIAVGAGMWSGAAHVGQTPYWVVASWLAWVLVGLGWSASGRLGRVAMTLLLAVWLGGAASSLVNADLPRTGSPSARSVAELRTHLELATAPGDAIVYLWEPLFLNDSPSGHDPLFSVFSPHEVGDWIGGDSPCPNYGFRWKNRSLCLLPASGMRGGEHEVELGKNVVAWLKDGAVVHLIQGALDPSKPPPSIAGLKARVFAASTGPHWSEARPGGVRVLRVATKP